MPDRLPFVSIIPSRDTRRTPNSQPKHITATWRTGTGTTPPRRHDYIVCYSSYVTASLLGGLLMFCASTSGVPSRCSWTVRHVTQRETRSTCDSCYHSIRLILDCWREVTIQIFVRHLPCHLRAKSSLGSCESFGK